MPPGNNTLTVEEVNGQTYDKSALFCVYKKHERLQFY